MKNIVIIGGTKGIGKAIVSEVVDRNKVVCLSRNQTGNMPEMFNLVINTNSCTIY